MLRSIPCCPLNLCTKKRGVQKRVLTKRRFSSKIQLDSYRIRFTEVKNERNA